LHYKYENNRKKGRKEIRRREKNGEEKWRRKMEKKNGEEKWRRKMEKKNGEREMRKRKLDEIWQKKKMNITSTIFLNYRTSVLNWKHHEKVCENPENYLEMY